MTQELQAVKYTDIISELKTRLEIKGELTDDLNVELTKASFATAETEQRAKLDSLLKVCFTDLVASENFLGLLKADENYAKTSKTGDITLDKAGIPSSYRRNDNEPSQLESYYHIKSSVNTKALTPQGLAARDWHVNNLFNNSFISQTSLDAAGLSKYYITQEISARSKVRRTIGVRYAHRQPHSPSPNLGQPTR